MTQMDLHTKYLLLRKIEKVKAVGSQSRKGKSNSKEEGNYLNNQGFFEAIAKGFKVITTMIMLVTKIMTKGARNIRTTKVDCICLLETVIMLLLARVRCP